MVSGVHTMKTSNQETLDSAVACGMPLQCDSCGASDPKFRCSSCQGVRCCSRKFQAYAWKKGGNKEQCKEIRARAEHVTERSKMLELVAAKKDLVVTINWL